jgi:hypothetical protein
MFLTLDCGACTFIAKQPSSVLPDVSFAQMIYGSTKIDAKLLDHVRVTIRRLLGTGGFPDAIRICIGTEFVFGTFSYGCF